MNRPEGHRVPEIGSRIKAARTGQAFTLDDLARLSGVSKSMLSQIERGQANPTFATLWNLTRPLEIEIQDLIRDSAEGSVEAGAIELLEAHFTPTITSPDGKCTLRILSPLASASAVEWYEMAAPPGGELRSAPHARGTMEHLTVTRGELRVESGSISRIVASGETARYRADLAHAIVNDGGEAAAAFLVVASKL